MEQDLYERGAPNTFSAFSAFASLRVQIYHPFLNPQGFFETFFAFFAPHRTPPVNSILQSDISPKKGEKI